jgi:lipid II:glycine glycyltransferase (peptidoglycan interpeptide bridge formation enzyme)
MFNVFEEISWLQFVKYSHVAKLPLNEQVKHYNQYLYQLSEARTSWITYQNKGPYIPTIQNIGFLAQEEYDSISQDYFTILQEDGSSIFVTALI